jgi:hypothetical protein
LIVWFTLGLTLAAGSAPSSSVPTAPEAMSALSSELSLQSVDSSTSAPVSEFSL